MTKKSKLLERLKNNPKDDLRVLQRLEYRYESKNVVKSTFNPWSADFAGLSVVELTQITTVSYVGATEQAV